MAYKEWTDGEILYADDLNTQFARVYSQCIVPFKQDHYYLESIDTTSGDITLPAGSAYRFKDMTVATNNLLLSGTNVSRPTVFFVEGNITITGSVLGSGIGFSGGPNETAGSSHTSLYSSVGSGEGGRGLNETSPGVGGSFYNFINEPTAIEYVFNALPGAGGGGGGDISGTDGGVGGAGGGAIIFITAGSFLGNGGYIDVSGFDGADGASQSFATGGGGGGAGGVVVIAYGGSYAAPTFNISGGAGGTGGTDTVGGGVEGVGGGGAGGVSGVGTAGQQDTPAVSGGDGGAGGAGSYYAFSF